jgi:enterochelin esterase-like enzyme
VRRVLQVLLVLLLTAGCSLEPQSWAALSKQVAGADPANRSALIEKYLGAHGGTPLIENQTRLIFLAQDVNGAAPRVVGDFNRWASTPQGYDATIGTMTRIDGTNWSFLEGAAYTNARLEYTLLYEKEARPDPLNPRLVQAYAGPRSEARMPFWVKQPELDEPAPVPAGELIAETLTSRALGGSRRVWFYLPPGYKDSTDLYPVVYILDGGNYIEKMDVPRVLDRLVARKAIPPVVAVFSEPVDRMEEYSRNPKWRAFVSTELVPMVDKRFRTFPAPDHRAIFGSSLAAYGAIDLSVEYPSLFGLCAAIAPPAQAATLITNQLKAKASVRSIRFFVLGGVYDAMIDGARNLRTTLDEANAAVTYLETPEGHSTETFRAHLDDAITALLKQ